MEQLDDEIIKTVFEYATKGFAETKKQLDELLSVQKSLADVKKKLEGLHKAERDELDKTAKKYAELNKTLNANASRKSREEFAKTKKELTETSAVITKTKDALEASDRVYKKVSQTVTVAKDSLAGMKEAQKALRKEFEATKIGSEQYEDLSKKLVEVGAEIKKVNEAEKDKQKTFNVSANSIDALRKKVGDLTKEWKTLDRSSPEFKARTSELAAYTEELKKAEQEVGIFNRSVGDYKTAIQGLNGQISNLAPSISGMVNPLKNATEGFNKLSATPLLGTLTILVSTFKFIIDAFRKTAEGQEKLNILFGAFNGIVQVLSDALSDLGEFLVELWEKPAEAFEKFKKGTLDVFNGYLEGVTNLARAATYAVAGIFSDEAKAKSEEYFEKSQEGFKKMLPFYDKVTAKVKEAVEIAKLENKLKADQVASVVELAQKETKIAQLKAESANKEKYTLESRLGMLAEALKLEQELLDKRLAKAKDELRLQEMKNALGKSSIEDLQAEADLKANVFRIEQEFFNSTKKLKKQLADFEAQERTAAAQEQQQINDAYIKSLSDVFSVQNDIAKARSEGADADVEMYTRVLALKEQKLKEASEKNIKLTEEELLAVEVATYEHQKKLDEIKKKEQEKKQQEIDREIEAYKKFEIDRDKLVAELDKSRDVEERKRIKKQLSMTEELVKKQIELLRAYGVEAESIPVIYSTSASKAAQSLVQDLANSLRTVQTFSGEAAKDMQTALLATAGVVGVAFELSNVKEKWGDDIKGMEEDVKRLKKELADVVQAFSNQATNAAFKAFSNSMNSKLELTKSYFAEQEKMLLQSQELERNEMQKTLDEQGASQAKAAFEKAKLDRKQFNEAKALKAQEVEETYKIQLAQFNSKKGQDITNIGIDAAVAVMKGFATLGPIGGAIQAAIVAALAATQIGVIAAKPAPQKPRYEKGGYLNNDGIIKGRSHEKGGVDIKIGDSVVAEAEGNEGVILVSKKAMQNPAMRSLFDATLEMNEKISGKNQSADKFAQGGLLPYQHFYDIAKAEAKKKYWLERKRQAYAQQRADELYRAYISEQERQVLQKEKSLTSSFDKNIAGNATLSAMGISSVKEYEKQTGTLEQQKKQLDDEIKLQKDYASAREDLLKKELKYEEKLSNFKEQTKAADEKFTADKLALDKKYLDELYKNNQITKEDYLSMLDQVTKGYGAKSSDIIALKKKEIEEIKKLIEQEREAQISATNETYKFQQQALDKMRGDWKKNYDELTKDAIKNIADSQKYIEKLTGTDLDRYKQIVAIEENIKKLNEDYSKNQSILSGDLILSREERAKLLAEQKRIEEELKQKEIASAEEKKAFEEERKKNQADALYQFEKDNADKIIALTKEQGALLQEQANKWTIDKVIAKELADELEKINKQFDKQVGAQDKIIADMEKSYKQAELLHEQKIKQIKTEEEALKNAFDKQKKLIDDAYTKATAGMQKDLANLNAQLTAIKVAGSAAGINTYEEALGKITQELNALPKYEHGGFFSTGTAETLGAGVFAAQGALHKDGGVNMYIGNKPIANIEGNELVAVASRKAAQDPIVQAAMRDIAQANNYYATGQVTAVKQDVDSKQMLEFISTFADRAGQSIAKSIDGRPVNAYITSSEVAEANRKHNNFNNSNKF